MASENRVIKNTAMLYLMNIAKMVFPLITLPYLTRVLSVDCYGMVSYVKAVMQYMQIIVDFGFILSGTKDIVLAKNNPQKLYEENGNILVSRLLLSGVAFVILCIVIIAIPILRANAVYTLLSFGFVFLTNFLLDYLFRGLEKMAVITYTFVAMKAVSTALTFTFVKNDSDILWIPVLDLVGICIAIGLISHEVKKMGIRFKPTGIIAAWGKIKDSTVYFFSNMATTAFMALNTLLIGIFIQTEQVAYWSVCLQMITAVQSLYTPLTNGIYPHMVKTKDITVVNKALKLYMPIITLGCIFTLIVAKYALRIVGGPQYVVAAPVLRCLVPVLFFSFLSMIYGWPVLGSIGKQKETTITTVVTAAIQIAGLVLLIITHHFTLIYISLLRGMTEALLFLLRFRYYRIFRNEFAA